VNSTLKKLRNWSVDKPVKQFYSTGDTTVFMVGNVRVALCEKKEDYDRWIKKEGAVDWEEFDASAEWIVFNLEMCSWEDVKKVLKRQPEIVSRDRIGNIREYSRNDFPSDLDFNHIPIWS